MTTPIQKILFGSPGTGKSYKIDDDIIPKLRIEKNSGNIIKAVFHPEYTYGDFVGKLMPITRSEKGKNEVEYNFYEGHFLRALGQAYKNILDNEENPKQVILVIDEINRGNSSAIFGSIFQLLDRNENGWSTYHINVSDMEFNKLVDIVFPDIESEVGKLRQSETKGLNEIAQKKLVLSKQLDGNKLSFLLNKTIEIPNNLSIVATMNTSDSSIYYMDTAFKRRWEWEFIDIKKDEKIYKEFAFEDEKQWKLFVDKLNSFIKGNHKHIRGIEDKQVGYYFIKDWLYHDKKIKTATVQNKLMFFLWDNVFNRDKTPLIELLYGKKEQYHDSLITFGDFAKQVDVFIEKINNRV